MGHCRVTRCCDYNETSIWRPLRSPTAAAIHVRAVEWPEATSLRSRPLAHAAKGTATSELPALLWLGMMAGSMGQHAAAGLPCLSQGRLAELPVWGSPGVVYRSAACCMGRGGARSGVVGPRGPGLSWEVMRPPTGLLLRASRACSWGAEGDCSGLCSGRAAQSEERSAKAAWHPGSGTCGARACLWRADAQLNMPGHKECSWRANAQPHQAQTQGLQLRDDAFAHSTLLGFTCCWHPFACAACRSLLLHHQCPSTPRRLRHSQSAAAKPCPAGTRKVICRCRRSGTCRATHCSLTSSLSIVLKATLMSRLPC